MPKGRDIYLYIPIIFITVLLVLGFILLFAQTLSSSNNLYLELLQSTQFWSVYLYSLKIASLTLVFSIAIFGAIFYLLFLLKYHFLDIKKWIFLLSLPILIPYALTAFLFFLIFFTFSDSSFFPFLLGTPTAMILAYIYKVVPFLLLVGTPSLFRLKKSEVFKHQIYSDDAFLFFKTIFLKRDLANFFVGFFIVFAYVINAYEIPAILGSSIEKMPASFTYDLFQEYELFSLQKAYASSILFFILSLFFVPIFFMAYKILKRIL